MDKILSDFEKHLKDKNLSENSVSSYILDIKKYLDFLKSNKISIKNRSIKTLKDFIKDEQRRNSDRTVNRVLASIGHFYNFTSQNKINPVKYIVRPSYIKGKTKVLTKKEIKMFFDSFYEGDIFELRNKTMFELMYSSGLKVSEVVNLMLSHLSNDYSTVKVNGRKIKLSVKGQKLLQTYISQSRCWIIGRLYDNYIFVSNKAEKLDRKSVWRIFDKHKRKSKISVSATLDSLRYTYAKEMFKYCFSNKEIKDFLRLQYVSPNLIKMEENVTRNNVNN